MLVIQTAGAPAAASGRFRRRPRPREAAPGSEPAQIPLTSLTVVSADPLADAWSRLSARAGDLSRGRKLYPGRTVDGGLYLAPSVGGGTFGAGLRYDY